VSYVHRHAWKIYSGVTLVPGVTNECIGLSVTIDLSAMPDSGDSVADSGQCRLLHRYLFWLNARFQYTISSVHSVFSAIFSLVSGCYLWLWGFLSNTSHIGFAHAAECCDERVTVFVSVCPQAYLRNYTSDLHRNFVHVGYRPSDDDFTLRRPVLLWRRRQSPYVRY